MSRRPRTHPGSLVAGKPVAAQAKLPNYYLAHYAIIDAGEQAVMVGKVQVNRVAADAGAPEGAELAGRSL